MTTERDFSASLRADPASPHVAREVLSCVLGAVADPDVVETVILLTSELVTNAVVHAGTESTVRVHVEPARHKIRVEVSDGVHAVPVRCNPSAWDGSGRGMMLVDRLASDWGVESTHQGKVVWFELCPD